VLIEQPREIPIKQSRDPLDGDVGRVAAFDVCELLFLVDVDSLPSSASERGYKMPVARKPEGNRDTLRADRETIRRYMNRR
jgi:hypothetical protein